MGTPQGEALRDGAAEYADELPLLDALLEHSPIAAAFVDRELRFVRVNRVLCAWLGMEEAAHLGKTVQEVIPHLWPALEPLFRKALAGETVLNDGVAGLTHSGASVYPVRLRGEIAGVGIILDDVTERRRAKDSLILQKNLYKMLARTLQMAVSSRGADELYRELCSIAVETGHFRFAWVGVPGQDHVEVVASAGDDGGYMSDAVVTLDDADPRSHGPTGRAVATRRMYVVNDFLAHPMTAPWHERARRVGFAASAAIPLLQDGAVVAVLTVYAPVVGFFTDDLVQTLSELTPGVSVALERLARQRELLREREELRMRDRALRAASQGIVIADAAAPDLPLVFASPSFLSMTGYTEGEVLGRNCRFLQGAGTDPAAVSKIRSSIAAQRACSVELLNYKKNGSAFWNELAISPVVDEGGRLTHFVGVQTDVTERRRLEDQLRQSQKLEAVGQLAAGIAHDFNNILTVVEGCASELFDGAQGREREELQEILAASERAVVLTRQLLAFTRQQVLAPRPTDLGELLTRMERMLRRLLGENILLALPRATGFVVMADPGPVEQVVMNLSVNARDAMANGGRFAIELEHAHVGDAEADRESVAPGDYVVLRFEDTGSGMDAATAERIFEPFFTTKGPGRGTGLGLSTVFGIVKQSLGHITVASRVGKGTTFRILLPSCTTDAKVETREPGSPQSARRGSETVLLVEDDDQVRRVISSALGRSGYRVLEAANAGEAILLGERYGDAIDLLLTDVVMPHANGRELADRLRRAQPRLRVLYVSGYTDNVINPGGRLQEGAHFLSKPMSPVVLLRKVREVLEGG